MPEKKTCDCKPRLCILSVFEVFIVSLKLGLTSFGGPIAHIGYFQSEYVGRKKWLDQKTFTDMVALCQFLPGPASSQLGIAIGTLRAGIPGGIAAWAGFTLPSFAVMVLFALLLQGFDFSASFWVKGLKIVAVAIVAQAVLSMWKSLVKRKGQAVIALASAVFLMFLRSAFTQVIIIAAAGIVGQQLYKAEAAKREAEVLICVKKRSAVFALILFSLLLLVLPLAYRLTGSRWVSLADSFYRAGSLVFGGGHVVMPLLEEELVPAGLISGEDFLAGYGAAQAIPGPLFTFAGYLGAMIYGIPGAFLALGAIFLPAYLLITGALPFWNSLRSIPKIQGALSGVNASVVGILMAALYDPLFTSAVHNRYEFSLSLLLLGMLTVLKIPPWAVVIAGAAGNSLIVFLSAAGII